MSLKYTLDQMGRPTCEFADPLLETSDEIGTDEGRCGCGDDEPLPPTAAEVRPSPKAIAKLHSQAAALSPVFTKEHGMDVQAEQACFLPIADRGRPLVGKVRGVEGVYVGSGSVKQYLAEKKLMGAAQVELLGNHSRSRYRPMSRGDDLGRKSQIGRYFKTSPIIYDIYQYLSQHLVPPRSTIHLIHQDASRTNDRHHDGKYNNNNLVPLPAEDVRSCPNGNDQCHSYRETASEETQDAFE